mmetsp:Transcript_110867/g.254057  ORF Transcript_110867/g.254057 Transcript_110867/m.254057 type:complete len:266 (-) Transcript_110867:184-981(-)
MMTSKSAEYKMLVSPVWVAVPRQASSRMPLSGTKTSSRHPRSAPQGRSQRLQPPPHARSQRPRPPPHARSQRPRPPLHARSQRPRPPPQARSQRPRPPPQTRSRRSRPPPQACSRSLLPVTHTEKSRVSQSHPLRRHRTAGVQRVPPARSFAPRKSDCAAGGSLTAFLWCRFPKPRRYSQLRTSRELQYASISEACSPRSSGWRIFALWPSQLRRGMLLRSRWRHSRSVWVCYRECCFFYRRKWAASSRRMGRYLSYPRVMSRYQ